MSARLSPASARAPERQLAQLLADRMADRMADRGVRRRWSGRQPAMTTEGIHHEQLDSDDPMLAQIEKATSTRKIDEPAPADSAESSDSPPTE